MRLLLGSGGFRTEERVRLLTEQMHSVFGPIDRLLFVPYALADHDGYVKTILERGLHAGYTLEGIHIFSDAREAVRNCQGIYVGGGNTFRLLDRLYRYDLLDLIRDRVHAGVPYLGVSAGTNVACPTMRTTNDMPIVTPLSLDALGLVPFQVNTHYYLGPMYVEGDGGCGHVRHFGETREDRIREFHEMNETPVVGLWEGGILRVENGTVQLLGTPARIFRRGQPPREVEPGARLDELLAE